jgi:hypothetical protein
VTRPGSPPNPRDVVAHPAERRDEVERRGAGRRGVPVAEQLGEVRVPEHPEAVVERDDDDLAALGEARHVEDGSGARSVDEAAAVHPDEDGAPGRRVA